MDHHLAAQLETQLKGKAFRGLIIEKLLNNGKSAAVFKAVGPGGANVALKIFDNDFLQRYGFDVQEKRINQEIALKNRGIKGLIEILDGGCEKIGDTVYFFITMAFIDGKNIKEYISDCTYADPFIKK